MVTRWSDWGLLLLRIGRWGVGGTGGTERLVEYEYETEDWVGAGSRDHGSEQDSGREWTKTKTRPPPCPTTKRT